MYKDARRPIQMQATDPEEFLKVYPEVKLEPAEIAAWEQNRQGMIVGSLLAQANGWKIGDRVPIRSQIWRKLDGSDTWQFDIVGIYDVDGGGVNKASAFFQYDYFNESLQFGKDSSGMIAVRVDDPKQAEAISRRIDAQFANSPFETKTATERDFVKRLLEQVGDIGSILVSVTAAVFFTMLLVTANTMAQSVSERTNEIGVLKTLGFGGRTILSLVLMESMFLTLTGGIAGLGLAWFLSRGVGAAIKDYFPSFHIGVATMITGISLMLAFGLVTGAWPALTAMRLKIVDALRRA
jgi:putative ABC transport system permease protein